MYSKLAEVLGKILCKGKKQNKTKKLRSLFGVFWEDVKTGRVKGQGLKCYSRFVSPCSLVKMGFCKQIFGPSTGLALHVLMGEG